MDGPPVASVWYPVNMWRGLWLLLKYTLAAFGLYLCVGLAAEELAAKRVGLGLGVCLVTVFTVARWWRQQHAPPPD